MINNVTFRGNKPVSSFWRKNTPPPLIVASKSQNLATQEWVSSFLIQARAFDDATGQEAIIQQIIDAANDAEAKGTEKPKIIVERADMASAETLRKLVETDFTRHTMTFSTGQTLDLTKLDFRCVVSSKEEQDLYVKVLREMGIPLRDGV